jgi:hypothetical protein
MLGALAALNNADENTKMVVSGLMGLLGKDSAKVAELSGAISQIAALKGVSVDQLLSSGALLRFIQEKLSGTQPTAESFQQVMASKDCPHCGKPIIIINGAYAPRS